MSIYIIKSLLAREIHIFICLCIYYAHFKKYIYLLTTIHQSFLLQNGPSAGFHQRPRSQHDGSGGHRSPPQPTDGAGHQHRSDMGRGGAACSVQRAVGPPGAAGLHRGPGLPSHPCPAAHVHRQAGQCCPGRPGGLPRNGQTWLCRQGERALCLSKLDPSGDGTLFRVWASACADTVFVVFLWSSFFLMGVQYCMLQWITDVCFDSVSTGLFECGRWRGCSDSRYCTRCQNMVAGDCVVSMFRWWMYRVRLTISCVCDQVGDGVFTRFWWTYRMCWIKLTDDCVVSMFR